MLSAVIAVLLAVAIIATSFAATYWDYLMSVLGKSGSSLDYGTAGQAAALGDDLVQEMAEDSAVMLKNEKNTLPLAEDNRKVNLFGYGSTRKGFIYSGGGSSGTVINIDRVPEERMEEIYLRFEKAVAKYDPNPNSELLDLCNELTSETASVYMEIGLQAGMLLREDMVKNVRKDGKKK